jgi:hypothetical protein
LKPTSIPSLNELLRDVIREKAPLTALYEIGDTTAVYSLSGPKFKDISTWEGEKPTWEYYFDTPDGDQYTIHFEGAYWEDDNDELQIENFADVSFESVDAGVRSKGAALTKQTFSVMATVVKAVNDFMANTPEIEKLRFSTTGENKDKVGSKFKLYKLYMDKHLDSTLGFMETEPDTGSGVIFRKRTN